MNTSVFGLGFSLISLWPIQAGEPPPAQPSGHESALVRQFLDDNAKDRQDRSLLGDHHFRQELLSFYLERTSPISAKDKLPVGVCFIGEERWAEAIKPLAEYVEVYSNDWEDCSSSA